MVLDLQSFVRGAFRDRRSQAGLAMLIPTLTLTLALMLACLLVPGCLLYTGPVNTAPEVEILTPMGPFARCQMVKVVAQASDADGDKLTLEWSTSPGPCPQPPERAARPPTIFQSPADNPSFTLTLPPDMASTVCVWVKVTDGPGASKTKAIAISDENRPPTALIEVLSPTTKASSGRYELYSSFRISSARSSDPDHGDMIAARHWTLEGMPQNATPSPKLVPCSLTSPVDLVMCLDARGVPGDYIVQLIVNDGTTDSTPQRLTLTVDNDHPACINDTAPPLGINPVVQDPAEAKTFTVKSVLDDGAPYPTPPDGTHRAPDFSWQLRRNAGPWQPIVGFEGLPELTLPAGSFASGDLVDVSVAISDGLATHLQPACNPGCPAGCPQTATWTVEYR
jgi:hypothetical protein